MRFRRNRKAVLLIVVGVVLLGAVGVLAYRGYGIEFGQFFAAEPGAATSGTHTAQVLSPNGGERWVLGETREIRWRISGKYPLRSTQRFSLYKDGKAIAAIFDEYVRRSPRLFFPQYQSFTHTWKVGTSITGQLTAPPGSGYKIKLSIIEQTSGKELAVDWSDASFIIAPAPSPTPTSPLPSPQVRVITPNGGETFTNNNQPMTYSVEIKSQRVGSYAIYFVELPNPDWQNGRYYYITNVQGVDPRVTSLWSGGVTLDSTFTPGNYYLFLTWKSDDGVETLYDFSNAAFGITIISPTPTPTPTPAP